jgi:hypothetical protein
MPHCGSRQYGPGTLGLFAALDETRARLGAIKSHHHIEGLIKLFFPLYLVSSARPQEPATPAVLGGFMFVGARNTAHSTIPITSHPFGGRPLLVAPLVGSYISRVRMIKSIAAFGISSVGWMPNNAVVRNCDFACSPYMRLLINIKTSSFIHLLHHSCPRPSCSHLFAYLPPRFPRPL